MRVAELACCLKNRFLYVKDMTFSVLILQTPPITISSSDVTHFLKTHDLTITTQQESRLLDITESSMFWHLH